MGPLLRTVPLLLCVTACSPGWLPSDGGVTLLEDGGVIPGGQDAGHPSPSACSSPVFQTSDTNGGWSTEGYYVHNNMWNDSVTLGPETLYACSYKSWYVTSNQTDEAGAVKTYPNVHKDYPNQKISTFTSITSVYAATSPHVGIYDVAYDLWINDYANEIMIWTDNYKQVPSGKKVVTKTFSGVSWDIWKTTDSSYIALVPAAPVPSGAIDLLEVMNYCMAQGWFASTSTLAQIGFGIEVVATGGGETTYTVSDFSITSH